MAGWGVSRAAVGVVWLKRASAITHRLGSMSKVSGDTTPAPTLNARRWPLDAQRLHMRGCTHADCMLVAWGCAGCALQARLVVHGAVIRVLHNQGVADADVRPEVDQVARQQHLLVPAAAAAAAAGCRTIAGRRMLLPRARRARPARRRAAAAIAARISLAARPRAGGLVLRRAQAAVKLGRMGLCWADATRRRALRHDWQAPACRLTDLIIGTINTNARQRPVVALPRFCLRAQRAQACPQLASSGRKPADPMLGSSRGGRKLNTVPTCAGAVRPLAAFAGPSRREAAAAADAPVASASGGLPPARTSSAQRPDACRPRQAATLDNFPADHSLVRAQLCCNRHGPSSVGALLTHTTSSIGLGHRAQPSIRAQEPRRGGVARQLSERPLVAARRQSRRLRLTRLTCFPAAQSDPFAKDSASPGLRSSPGTTSMLATLAKLSACCTAQARRGRRDAGRSDDLPDPGVPAAQAPPVRPPRRPPVACQSAGTSLSPQGPAPPACRVRVAPDSQGGLTSLSRPPHTLAHHTRPVGLAVQ